MKQRKELKDMTLEELWELFPITLTPHQPQWGEWAMEEIQSLSAILAAYKPTINHIGSTALPTICAKPIIDILVEVPPATDRQMLCELMEGSGYICMNRSADRMSFNKGYTPEGYAERVFHIHVHPDGDNDEILFRDYLLAHTDIAKEYETLKQSLILRYSHNRDAYTDSKTDFVRRVVAMAKATR